MVAAPRVPGQQDLPDEDILQDMRIAAQHCPRGDLSLERYNKFGRYHSNNAIVRFGSWNAALQLALPDVYARRHPTPEDMIADVYRVAEICRQRRVTQFDPQSRDWKPTRAGKVYLLSKTFYDKHGKYAHTYLVTHLAKEHLKVSSWHEMKVALGLDDL